MTPSSGVLCGSLGVTGLVSCSSPLTVASWRGFLAPDGVHRPVGLHGPACRPAFFLRDFRSPCPPAAGLYSWSCGAPGRGDATVPRVSFLPLWRVAWVRWSQPGSCAWTLCSRALCPLWVWPTPGGAAHGLGLTASACQLRGQGRGVARLHGPAGGMPHAAGCPPSPFPAKPVSSGLPSM